jgi:Ca2+-binding EF-hand superfamily protein
MMVRALTFIVSLVLFAPGIAAAQQPCTTDARRVVDELYRHMLERSADDGSANWVSQLQNGRMTVRQVVRAIATSPEHTQRFWRTENGEGTPYIRSVNTMYRHILARQADEAGARMWAETAASRGPSAVVDALLNSQEYSGNFGDWGVPGSGGVNFCAQGTNSTANTVNQNQNQSASVDASGRDTRRFAVMDRNNDGVVSRNEWRGSRQSFTVHDWNNDGVLSGDEVREGAFRQGQTVDDQDFDRAETFENLDWNNNNRIDRAEWHGTADAFAWLDRNSDNVLTRAEMGANVNANRGGRGGRGAINRDAVGTTGDTIVVSSTERWVDTGIDVRAGDILLFDVQGTIRMSDNGNDVANAGGSVNGRRANNSPIPSAPAGGLIARVGNREPVYVGERRALRVPANGRLFLSVNDDFLGDNEGQYRVTVDFQNR